MTERQIQISYQEYKSIDEMNPEDRDLAAEAIKAMQGAYAPYSHFHVGAAVRMSNGQIVRGCKDSVAAGAAFVKTSTGFSKGGATLHDVALMRAAVGDGCRVKAAGGIHNADEARAMIEAGADRIGTSSGIAIVEG